MAKRPKPPEDITADDFYLRWIPEQMAADPEQREKLKAISTVIQMQIIGEGGGDYILELEGGDLRTNKGKADSPKLMISMAVPEWREINASRLSLQMAFMSGKLKISGDMSLSMKLGSILGT